MIDDAITQPLAMALLVIFGLGIACFLVWLLIEAWRLRSRVNALEAWRSRCTTRYRGSPYREPINDYARKPLEGAVPDCDGCPNYYGIVECELCQKIAE